MSVLTLFAYSPVCYHHGMAEIKYWVSLCRVLLLGTVRFCRLEAFFVKAKKVWQASLSELKAVSKEYRVAKVIIAASDKVSPDGEMAKLAKSGVKAVNWHHPDYPSRLKEIHDPPPVPYNESELLTSDEHSVAVVGTRSPATYGREVAANPTADLDRNGITIVSGLVLGIDGISHRAASFPRTATCPTV
jgi:DNA processing protein